jgi:hypothetical protein
MRTLRRLAHSPAPRLGGWRAELLTGAVMVGAYAAHLTGAG